ncbi:hypothetical protein B6U81_04045 [Thermoplasmatales archaeon ex4484_30]|nr:MAG: hypothetical protein FE041_03370 [Thermoplasmata archaeon]OYT61015.1 MAG: hypothetical protein B6U81_04045 [Thermoplasmatales archaeon ex4484_30]
MEEFPVIKVRKGKVKRGEKIWKKRDALQVIEELVKQYDMVYIIDVDGYNRNNPNLDLYKKIGKNLWIDSFPRRVEDVVDLIVVGAERITIKNMEGENIKELKEICEKDIYISGDDPDAFNKLVKYNLKGLVIDEVQEIKKDVQTWKIYKEEWVIKRVK